MTAEEIAAPTESRDRRLASLREQHRVILDGLRCGDVNSRIDAGNLIRQALSDTKDAAYELSQLHFHSEDMKLILAASRCKVAATRLGDLLLLFSRDDKVRLAA